MSHPACRSETKTMVLMVVNAIFLATPGGAFPMTPDGKSLIAKGNGWTWTYTPTPVR